MKSPKLPPPAVAVVCFLAVAALARAEPEKERAPDRKDAAAEWAQLQADFSPDRRGAKGAMERAEAAKRFYAAHPESPGAVRARKMEVMALLEAAGNRDAQAAQRFQTAATAIRADTTLPEADRAEISGYWYFQQALAQARHQRELPERIEAGARRLVAEFPRQPQGYETLLTVAGWSPDHRAVELLRELVASAAPETVKHSARLRLTLLALPGQRLPDVLADTAMAGQLTGLDRPVVLYSWASWSPESVALANFLGQRKAAGAVWIGINLDTDTVAAAAEVQRGSFPGTQVFAGPDGPLARRLGLDQLPLVILADAQGVIRDIHGKESLETKLAALGL